MSVVSHISNRIDILIWKGVGKTMDVSLEDLKRVMEPQWGHFGRKKSLETSEKVAELMNNEKFKRAATGR